MSTIPGVLMGPNLTSFIASNFALLQPTLVPIYGSTFVMSVGTGYAHLATVSSFQMGRTPVTNEQYQRYIAALGVRRHALIGTDPATKGLGVIALGPDKEEVRVAVEAAGWKERVDPREIVEIRDNNPPAGFDGPRQPVVYVNWFEAAVYAFLHGGMLPTQYQWEYAATKIVAFAGYRAFATPSGHLTHEEAHFGAKTTIDVDDGRYPTLDNRLRHMTGNVWEWMQNWFSYRYIYEHDSEHPAEEVDPTGPLEGVKRSLRGGSFLDFDKQILLAVNMSYAMPPDFDDFTVGFRVAAAFQGFRK